MMIMRREGHHRGRDKYLIIHADDLGMCHSINAATFYASQIGAITSASVMVPCAWYPEVVSYAQMNGDLDLGVHLTITSEWSTLRWRPIGIASQSLVDSEGYFWRDIRGLSDLAEETLLTELRAQVLLFLSSGLHPTHLDSHMFALFTSDTFFRAYLRVANEYRTPALILTTFPSCNGFTEINIKSNCIVDSQQYAPETLAADQWESFYLDTIQSLEPGINQLTVHLGYDNVELRAAMGDNMPWGSAWRSRDLSAITSPTFKKQLKQCDINLISWSQASVIKGEDGPSL